MGVGDGQMCVPSNENDDIRKFLPAHGSTNQICCLLCVQMLMHLCLLPIDFIEVLQATAVHIVEMFAAMFCKMIHWSSS